VTGKEKRRRGMGGKRGREPFTASFFGGKRVFGAGERRGASHPSQIGEKVGKRRRLLRGRIHTLADAEGKRKQEF